MPGGHTQLHTVRSLGDLQHGSLQGGVRWIAPPDMVKQWLLTLPKVLWKLKAQNLDSSQVHPTPPHKHTFTRTHTQHNTNYTTQNTQHTHTHTHTHTQLLTVYFEGDTFFYHSICTLGAARGLSPCARTSRSHGPFLFHSSAAIQDTTSRYFSKIVISLLFNYFLID